MQSIASPSTTNIASTFLNTFSTSIDSVQKVGNTEMQNVPDTPEFKGK